MIRSVVCSIRSIDLRWFVVGLLLFWFVGWLVRLLVCSFFRSRFVGRSFYFVFFSSRLFRGLRLVSFGFEMRPYVEFVSALRRACSVFACRVCLCVVFFCIGLLVCRFVGFRRQLEEFRFPLPRKLALAHVSSCFSRVFKKGSGQKCVTIWVVFMRCYVFHYGLKLSHAAPADNKWSHTFVLKPKSQKRRKNQRYEWSHTLIVDTLACLDVRIPAKTNACFE